MNFVKFVKFQNFVSQYFLESRKKGEIQEIECEIEWIVQNFTKKCTKHYIHSHNNKQAEKNWKIFFWSSKKWYLCFSQKPIFTIRSGKAEAFRMFSHNFWKISKISFWYRLESYREVSFECHTMSQIASMLFTRIIDSHKKQKLQKEARNSSGI